MPSSATTASTSDSGKGIALETSLRLGAQYRRCCWYLLLGSWLIVGLALMLRRQLGLPQTDGSSLAAGLALPALSLLLLLTAESWRMRIDSSGISRRRWWFWSTWPWEAFRAGRISRNFQSGRYVYICSDRPWGDRRLHFDWLADDDRTIVDQLCRQVLLSATKRSMTPAEIVSDGRGRFTGEGIYLSFPWERKPPSLIPWSDVEKLHLHWRLAEDGLSCRVELQALGSKSKRAVFRQLEAITSTGEKFRPANEIEHVEQFIAPRLEPSRFASYQIFDSPRNPPEATYQVEHFRRRLQSARWCYGILNAFGLIAAIGIFVGKIIPAAGIIWAEPLLPWHWKVTILSCGVLIALTGPLLLAGLTWITFSKLRQRITRAKRVLAAST